MHSLLLVQVNVIFYMWYKVTVFVFKQNCGRTVMIFELCLWVYLTA